MKIAILGAGAWGSALAIALSEQHHVTLWARDRAARRPRSAAAKRNTRYLPEVALPDRVSVTAELETALSNAGPGAGRDSDRGAAPGAGERSARPGFDGPVVWACKGFEQASGKAPSPGRGRGCSERAPRAVPCPGPSFALEVARGLPTALTLASRDADFAKRFARELHQPTLRVYYSTDVVGRRDQRRGEKRSRDRGRHR
mgnify:CR=1 FL=1